MTEPRITHFIIDPPWPQKKGGRRRLYPNQGRELDYATMPLKEIFQLLDEQVFVLAMKNHNVFLWEIDKFLVPAEQEMEARGYRHHARFIWDKGNGVAPAFTVRYSHEYLVWWYKETMIPVEQSMRGKLTTVMQEKSREHSRKPDIAYSIVDSLYPCGCKLDVFSREPRPGWEQWGDQPNQFGGQHD